MTASDDSTTWHKILEPDQLDEGRVTTVSVGVRSFAVSRYDGQYGCVDNACPHQGGPLGEGSIEQGWLRCPWHGYDYSPLTGQPPEGFSDAPACFDTEVRDDGVYVALPPEPEPVRTVSDVVVETLTNWGLTHVFGMVGHSNLGFADAMRKAEERGDLTYIGIRHEGAAAFAASAFGKLTGGVAGCFGIAGPGSTNLLTGLYDAKEDRAPVLALSGQVPSKVKGRGAFQDTDLEAAFADVAEFSESVHAESNHAELANLAMKTAIVGRNVAHLVFPDEAQHLPAPDGAAAGGPGGRAGSRLISPDPADVGRAVDMIAAATRPMIVVGHGARRQMDRVVALAERIHAPVATTFKAKGLIADDHPLGCGVMGRSGTPVASWFMNECDLLIVFGASFSNHTGLAEYKPTIQVDDDAMSLGRFHSVDVPLQGNVEVTAQLLSEALPDAVAAIDVRAEIAERRSIWQAEKARRVEDDAGRGIGAAALMASLTRNVDADAVICVDVGNNTYSFGRYFEASGRQDVLMSGYLGSIGFSLPAAMGAWAAAGDSRQIVSVSGDGGFGQYAMELTTAVKYDMNITHVLMNNGELGKISKEQRAAHWDVWQTSLHNPEFAAFAELCGAKGIRVTSPDELDEALRTALDHDGPALVEVVTDALLV
ncbi:MAG: thiamine pyrophosphate-binding protein [Ilumatobacter sp.]|uniref:thiamine pyrophosphate-dependent enzyme n=1 Tax=Ilumatobacter sp. TaxID=1967498 RepID=UPI00262F8F05|nr:thiamine pyrophosphate-dependent enzyme [Ilumatobacter sp.]MDJ0769596.1 thiamine pyrophosphate-binding protein [Ilumatobacter sp.]